MIPDCRDQALAAIRSSWRRLMPVKELADSRQREREEARRLDAADRDTAHGEAGERGAAGRDPRAARAGHGSANG